MKEEYKGTGPDWIDRTPEGTESRVSSSRFKKSSSSQILSLLSTTNYKMITLWKSKSGNKFKLSHSEMSSSQDQTNSFTDKNRCNLDFIPEDVQAVIVTFVRSWAEGVQNHEDREKGRRFVSLHRFCGTVSIQNHPSTH